MSLRQLSKSAVVQAIHSAGDARYDRLLGALADDPRDKFTTTDAPALLLRENLKLKHRIARNRGKAIRGDDELLMALADLGSEPVSGVFTDHHGKHIALYLRAETLEPVGYLIIEDSPRP